MRSASLGNWQHDEADVQYPFKKCARTFRRSRSLSRSRIAHSLRKMSVSSRYALRQTTIDSAAMDSRRRKRSCDSSEPRQIVRCTFRTDCLSAKSLCSRKSKKELVQVSIRVTRWPSKNLSPQKSTPISASTRLRCLQDVSRWCLHRQPLGTASYVSLIYAAPA